jgi:hypothetical protein
MDRYPEGVIIPTSSIMESLCDVRDLLPRVKSSSCPQAVVNAVASLIKDDTDTDKYK